VDFRKHQATIMKKLLPAKVILSLCSILSMGLSSCGSYETVSAPTQSQSVPVNKGVRSVSGKPNLHVPARMGILSSARFPMHSLSSDDLKLLQQSDISSIIPINTYVDSGRRYQLNDMLHRRAEIIDSTRFLGLDVILLCDESVSATSKQVAPPLQWFSLGIVNPESHKTQAQLDAVMIDARTGFIYGAVGDAGTSNGMALTFLESEFVKQSGESRASDSARKQLIKRFPAFWENVKRQHKR
jgi:hypothetical protein